MHLGVDLAVPTESDWGPGPTSGYSSRSLSNHENHESSAGIPRIVAASPIHIFPGVLDRECRYVPGAIGERAVGVSSQVSFGWFF